MKTETETWRSGSRIEYTGKVETIHGDDWREFRWIEGPRKNEAGWAPTEEQDAKNAEQRTAAHKRQQAGFARLASNAETAQESAMEDAMIRLGMIW